MSQEKEYPMYIVLMPPDVPSSELQKAVWIKCENEEQKERALKMRWRPQEKIFR